MRVVDSYGAMTGSFLAFGVIDLLHALCTIYGSVSRTRIKYFRLFSSKVDSTFSLSLSLAPPSLSLL